MVKNSLEEKEEVVVNISVENKEIDSRHPLHHSQLKRVLSHSGAKIPLEPRTLFNLGKRRGVEAMFSWWCGHPPLSDGTYTDDAYTLVRNHPLFITAQQESCQELVEHSYHTELRQHKLRSFGLIFFITSFFGYMAYMSTFTTLILKGKHPQYFYDIAGYNFTNDLQVCEQVSNYFVKNPTMANEIFKTGQYRSARLVLFCLLIGIIVKDLIMIAALFPKVFRLGAFYIEVAALVLSYVYVLDWYPWQSDLIMRCPVQYQLGAMGLLIAYMNLLVYFRTSPGLNMGVHVVMFQVVSAKFLRFLPILLVILLGFGLTYWMLLQNQPVYGTPMEAIMRTSLMLFDLGYESRLYNQKDGGIGYYGLVYFVFILTAVTFSVFVINMLIGKILRRDLSRRHSVLSLFSVCEHVTLLNLSFRSGCG